MTAPIYDQDIFSDDFISDPFPRYAEMRALGRVLWLPRHDAFAVTRHAEAVACLRNGALFRSGEGLSLNPEVNAILKGSTLNSDGEQHARRRAVTAVPIMPKGLKELDARITQAGEALAERLVHLGRFDGVADMAQVLPLAIVTDLVGLHPAGRDRMLDWAAATFDLFEGFNARSKAAWPRLREMRDFLEVHGRAEALTPGGLARRIFEVAPAHGFTEAEAAQMMRDYIPPSLDTTISTIGFAAYLFAKHPEEWTRLRADPSLIPGAIEEVVRLATPIRAFSRLVAEDTSVAGVPIPQGARVLILYASANRDPEVFPDPDHFDVARAPRKHLGFGHGPHSCMGMHLARLEIRRLLEALVSKVKHWHLDGVPQVAMNNTIRAFAHLPLRIDPLP